MFFSGGGYWSLSIPVVRLETFIVSGAMPFYGMNCSQNQNELIGAIDGALGSIPVIGGALSAIVTAIGRGLCG
jgi:hypothetical protein